MVLLLLLLLVVVQSIKPPQSAVWSEQLLPGGLISTTDAVAHVWTHERQKKSEKRGRCPSSPGGSAALPAAAPVSNTPPHGVQGDPRHEQRDAEVTAVPLPTSQTGELDLLTRICRPFNSPVIVSVQCSVLVQKGFVKHGHLFAVQGPPSPWETVQTNPCVNSKPFYRTSSGSLLALFFLSASSALRGRRSEPLLTLFVTQTQTFRLQVGNDEGLFFLETQYRKTHGLHVQTYSFR